VVESGIYFGRKRDFVVEGGVLVVERRLSLLILFIRPLVLPSIDRTVEGEGKRSNERRKRSKEIL
jgi:hypothetical protein